LTPAKRTARPPQVGTVTCSRGVTRLLTSTASKAGPTTTTTATPVADPLAFPNPAEITSSGLTTLFQWTDPESGSQVEQPVHDIKVDNLANCVHPGGLQAHNYWDNLPEFIGSLARILT
jgi:hypothetical protein